MKKVKGLYEEDWKWVLSVGILLIIVGALSPGGFMFPFCLGILFAYWVEVMCGEDE